MSQRGNGEEGSSVRAISRRGENPNVTSERYYVCARHYQTMKCFGNRRPARAALASAIVLATNLAAAMPLCGQVQPATGALKYPATARGGQADDLSGVRVAD